jgi:uncharacterized protein
MNLQSVFINDAGRIRSGWRFLIFFLLFIFVGMILGAAAQSLLSRLAIDFSPRTLLFMSVNGFLSFAAAIFIGWLCGKYLENLPFRALGAWFTRNWLKDLGLGLLTGAAALSLAVLIAVAFGGLRFNFNQAHGSSAIWLTLGVSLAVFAVAAAFEEAFFRGYILQTFARANLAWLAIAMTSLFFASAHLGNPNASFLSTLNTALAGIWFGAAYLKTRTLWFVFGLHLAWNWMQGAVFGIEVSGITSLTTAPLLQEIDSGPVWLTGADYGIEGGIACTVSLIVTTLAIWFSPILKPTEEMLALTDRENPVHPKENIN